MWVSQGQPERDLAPKTRHVRCKVLERRVLVRADGETLYTKREDFGNNFSENSNDIGDFEEDWVTSRRI